MISVQIGLVGKSKNFLPFYKKIWMHNIFRFILFYRITCYPFCSIKMKITSLGFMFV